VWMLTALRLESASKSPLHGSEYCPVQRLELVRVTGRNEPKSDPEICRAVSDLWRPMDRITVQDQIELTTYRHLLAVVSGQPIEIVSECFLRRSSR
jgi:hypothetical protein